MPFRRGWLAVIAGSALWLFLSKKSPLKPIEQHMAPGQGGFISLFGDRTARGFHPADPTHREGAM